MSQFAIKRGGQVLISAASTLDDGARAALVTLPGAFRLDVQVLDDDLRVGVRNLSPLALESHPPLGTGALSAVGDGVGPELRVYRHDTGFDLGEISVRVAIAILRERAWGRSAFIAHARIDTKA